MPKLHLHYEVALPADYFESKGTIGTVGEAHKALTGALTAAGIEHTASIKERNERKPGAPRKPRGAKAA